MLLDESFAYGRVSGSCDVNSLPITCNNGYYSCGVKFRIFTVLSHGGVSCKKKLVALAATVVI